MVKISHDRLKRISHANSFKGTDFISLFSQPETPAADKNFTQTFAEYSVL